MHAIELEAVGFYGYEHLSLHDKCGIVFDLFHQFLFSCCFCQYCITRFHSAGLDANHLAAAFRERLLAFFEGRAARANDAKLAYGELGLLLGEEIADDAYAGAFGIIHNNLDAAMRAANITGATGTLNAQAKSAARSAFESAKQRFFGHLLTSMKTPSLIRSIEHDLDAGHAAVIQIVSTGEALMERRLAEIPTEDWGDVQVDITPREYVLDYLAHSFPVQLYEPFTDF